MLNVMQKYNKMTSISKKRIEIILMVILIAVIALFPYLKDGIAGYKPDMLYHMLRVEGVKEGLLNGKYPSYVYTNFFEGYGYGSGLFYPDIFLILPAILRILGASPVLAWKIFVFVIVIFVVISTYCSSVIILNDHRIAIATTFLITLSQFYLADLMERLGLSEYIAYIFIPLVLAATYDFFEHEGKRIYLLGVGFCGLLLTHSIMTFVSFIMVAILFLIGIVGEIKNKKHCYKRKWINLVITVLISVLVTAYYTLPMIEQIFNTRFMFSTPWAHIGDYTQPVETFFRATGYFDYIAYVGVGIPLLLLLISRVLLGKAKNKMGELFYVMGCLSLFSMTSFFPWYLLNNTIFNSIQFTYRIYPWSIILLSVAVMMIIRDNIEYRKKNNVIFIIIVISMLFGLWQNYSTYKKDYSEDITEEYLDKNAYYTGRGEWFPSATQIDGENLLENSIDEYVLSTVDVEPSNGMVKFNSNEIEGKEYIVKLIYYKGYVAQIETDNGDVMSLPCTMSETGLVKVLNESELSGIITVSYKGTLIQKVSRIVSCITIALLLIYCMIKGKKKNGVCKN